MLIDIIGPVWTSLAWDYLPIMASSVSSECVFLQGGIAISKYRSQLKGNIIKALQCVKCIIQHDLIFHEPDPSSAVETELLDDEPEDDEKNKEDDESSWDALIDDEDDIFASDGEDDENFDVDVDGDLDSNGE
jgi:hypothetical protein